MSLSPQTSYQFSRNTPYLPSHPRKRRLPYEVLLRQFNSEIQRSGLLTEVRKRRYFSKDPSRMLRKLAAIRKADRKKQLRGY